MEVQARILISKNLILIILTHPQRAGMVVGPYHNTLLVVVVPVKSTTCKRNFINTEPINISISKIPLIISLIINILYQ